MMGVIYILQLSAPLGNEKHSARYYVGYTDNLKQRLKYHRWGLGSSFMRAVKQKGLTFRVIYTQEGDRTEERRIKSLKNTKRFLKSKGVKVDDNCVF